MTTYVSDLSIDEFRTLIRETVTQTLTDLIGDPDEGLELRDDFKVELQHSLEDIKMGEETFSAESVATQLGLKW